MSQEEALDLSMRSRDRSADRSGLQNDEPKSPTSLETTEHSDDSTLSCESHENGESDVDDETGRLSPYTTTVDSPTEVTIYSPGGSIISSPPHQSPRQDDHVFKRPFDVSSLHSTVVTMRPDPSAQTSIEGIITNTEPSSLSPPPRPHSPHQDDHTDDPVSPSPTVNTASDSRTQIIESLARSLYTPKYEPPSSRSPQEVHAAFKRPFNVPPISLSLSVPRQIDSFPSVPLPVPRRPDRVTSVPLPVPRQSDPVLSVPLSVRRQPDHVRPVPLLIPRQPEPSLSVPLSVRRRPDPVPSVPLFIPRQPDPVLSVPLLIQRRPGPVPPAPLPVTRQPEPVPSVPLLSQRRPGPVPSVPLPVPRQPEPFFSVPLSVRRRPEPVPSVPLLIQRQPEPFLSVPLSFRRRPGPVPSVPLLIPRQPGPSVQTSPAPRNVEETSMLVRERQPDASITPRPFNLYPNIPSSMFSQNCLFPTQSGPSVQTSPAPRNVEETSMLVRERQPDASITPRPFNLYPNIPSSMFSQNCLFPTQSGPSVQTSPAPRNVEETSMFVGERQSDASITPRPFNLYPNDPLNTISMFSAATVASVLEMYRGTRLLAEISGGMPPAPGCFSSFNSASAASLSTPPLPLHSPVTPRFAVPRRHRGKHGNSLISETCTSSSTTVRNSRDGEVSNADSDNHAVSDNNAEMDTQTISPRDDSACNFDEGHGPSSSDVLKDKAYHERRKKNNEAARKSRGASRQRAEELRLRCVQLEQEHIELTASRDVYAREVARLQYLYAMESLRRHNEEDNREDNEEDNNEDNEEDTMEDNEEDNREDNEGDNRKDNEGDKRKDNEGDNDESGNTA